MTIEAPVAVRSLTDLVELIPSLVGFHPEDSVVVAVLQDGGVPVAARVDLPPSPAVELAAALGPVWRRFPAAEYVVVVYATDYERAWAFWRLLAAGLPTQDRTLIVADGHHWFADPDDSGTPYDDWTSPRVAAAAAAGQQVLPSRKALAELLAPTRTPSEVQQALARIEASSVTGPGLVAAGLSLLAAADGGETDIDVEAAMMLTLASHDEHFLDAAMISTTRLNAEARRDLWSEVVRQSIPNCTGFALAACALAAWLCGQGALQVVCLELMEGKPGPAQWFDTLCHINAEALPPSAWPDLRASLFGAEQGVSLAAAE